MKTWRCEECNEERVTPDEVVYKRCSRCLEGMEVVEE